LGLTNIVVEVTDIDYGNKTTYNEPPTATFFIMDIHISHYIITITPVDDSVNGKPFIYYFSYIDGQPIFYHVEQTEEDALEFNIDVQYLNDDINDSRNTLIKKKHPLEFLLQNDFAIIPNSSYVRIDKANNKIILNGLAGGNFSFRFSTYDANGNVMAVREARIPLITSRKQISPDFLLDKNTLKPNKLNPKNILYLSKDKRIGGKEGPKYGYLSILKNNPSMGGVMLFPNVDLPTENYKYQWVNNSKR
jgi:hypothetical protein